MAVLEGERILITGATGQVAHPVAQALAATNEVWAVARFRSRRARARLEDAGVHCLTVDLADPDLSGLPGGITVVCNFAVAHTQDWDADLAVNAEAAGLLMARCRDARAVLHVSSTGVYRPAGDHRLVETDPLGDSHAPIGLGTYSITKIAAEAVVRAAARMFDLPTTIARLNVPYGNGFGWPFIHLAMMRAGQPVDVHVDGPCVYNPIHLDDIVGQMPALLDAASVPATIVNWAGSEVVAVEDWCAWLGELTGIEPTFRRTEAALASVAVDTTRLTSIAGPATVAWRDGFRAMVEHERAEPGPAEPAPA
ncbi:MAG: NAD(P)-dependent oxidoreductase [Actinobacteria bacterium]|nr:NAD(P)-dependent oxidoreductase [Actinomycetota bacterium]